MRLEQGLLASDVRTEFSNSRRDRHSTDVSSAGAETTARYEYRIIPRQASEDENVSSNYSTPVGKQRLDFLLDQ